jgi:hypothetical protein
MSSKRKIIEIRFKMNTVIVRRELHIFIVPDARMNEK